MEIRVFPKSCHFAQFHMKISVFLPNLAILLRLPSFGQYRRGAAPKCIYGPWTISARASRRVSLQSTGWGLVGLSCRASGYGRFARFHAFTLESVSAAGVFKREVLSWQHGGNFGMWFGRGLWLFRHANFWVSVAMEYHLIKSTITECWDFQVPSVMWQRQSLQYGGKTHWFGWSLRVG